MSIAAFSWSAKKKGGFLSGPSSRGAPPPGTSGRRAGPRGGGSGRARRGREGQGQKDKPKTASGRSWLCRSCLAQNQKTERTIDEIGLPWKSEGLAVVGTRCLESTYDDKRHAIQTPQINATAGHGRRVDPERKSLMSPTKSREGKERKDGQHLISRYNKERHRRQGCSNVRCCDDPAKNTNKKRDNRIGIWMRSLEFRRGRVIRDVGALLPVVRGTGFRYGDRVSMRSRKHSVRHRQTTQRTHGRHAGKKSHPHCRSQKVCDTPADNHDAD